jgi:hypothetical protein
MDTENNLRNDVLFYGGGQGVSYYITATGIHYVFIKPDSSFVNKSKSDIKNHEKKEHILYRMDMELVNSNTNLKAIRAEDQLEGVTNFFLSQYKDGVTGVRSFSKITLEGVYNGIDMVIVKKDNQLKYDFIVHPGADLSLIKMKYSGHNKISLDVNGNLSVENPLGLIIENAPLTFLFENKKAEIVSSFNLVDDVVGFTVSDYDKEQVLDIDPCLFPRTWATYFGHNANGGHCNEIINDINGNIIGVGEVSNIITSAVALPFAVGQTVFGGMIDGFVAKFNSTGNMLWWTYYGGSDWESLNSVTTQGSTSIFAVGFSFSANSPMVSPAGYYNDPTYNGGSDGVVLRLNPTTGILQWATYFGGAGDDEIRSIDFIGSPHNFFSFVGVTTSTAATFPDLNATTQPNLAGQSDAFIAKFKPGTGGTWVQDWCTYMGSSNADHANKVDIHTTGDIFLTGMLGSGFTTTLNMGPNAFNQFLCVGGGGDAFIAQYSKTQVKLWITYYGGSGLDEGRAISIDSQGSIIVGGITTSSNMPFMITPLCQAYNDYSLSFNNDMFLLKFTSLYVPYWNTLVGGSSTEVLNDIWTDASNSIFVTGSTLSSDFPLLNAGFAWLGGEEPVILEFSANGRLEWSTYYGQTNLTYGGMGICKTSAGVWVDGALLPHATTSPTGGGYQETSGASAEIPFFARFEDCPVFWIDAPDFTICRGATVSPVVNIYNGIGSYTYTYSPSLSPSPSVTTTYTVTVCDNGTGLCACDVFIVNLSTLAANAGVDKSFCSSMYSTTLGGTPTASGGVPGYTYSWSPSTYLNSTTIANPTYSVIVGQCDVITYTVTVTDANGCTATDAVKVTCNHCRMSAPQDDPSSSFNSFTIYPNPNSGTFIVMFSEPDKDQTLDMKITDVLGKTIFEKKNFIPDLEIQLDLSNYPKGIYMVQVLMNNGEREIKKVVIQ